MPANEPRIYSPAAFIRILLDMSHMAVKHGRQIKLISKKFRSHIMLAVTYVNGCRVCSYYHTQVLLKEGASPDDIKPLLEGTFDDLETDETTALLFAQHYADTRGVYDPEAYRALQTVYGEEVSTGILGTIKMIMFGNVNGIALGNLWDRLRLKKTVKSSLFYDLFNGLSPVILVPVFMAVSALRRKGSANSSGTEKSPDPLPS